MLALRHKGIVAFERQKINFRNALIMYAVRIAHKREVALSLRKSLYSVCQYDYENVTASQYWFTFYKLEFSRPFFPFLVISMSMEGILSSTGSSIVNVRLGFGPFRVVIKKHSGSISI